jgi:hypothetical protein
MTERENQLRLDRIALRYLTAIDASDFDAIEALWTQAADDPDLDAMLYGLNAELASEQESQERESVTSAVLEAIEHHLPSAEIMRPEAGQLLVSEVAEHIRRHPPRGLTIDDLKLNDALRRTSEPVPTELGISQVIRWGTRFGTAPQEYWRAFREAALDLWMQRTSAETYRMAARPQRPKRKGEAP